MEWWCYRGGRGCIAFLSLIVRLAIVNYFSRVIMKNKEIGNCYNYFTTKKDIPLPKVVPVFTVVIGGGGQSTDAPEGGNVGESLGRLLKVSGSGMFRIEGHDCYMSVRDNGP